jgi:hypothetical protein
MLETASITVGQLISSRCDSAEPTLAKKLSPFWGTPSTLPSCPAATGSLVGSPAAATATAAAVSADSVEVVLTDSGREVPSSV